MKFGKSNLKIASTVNSFGSILHEGVSCNRCCLYSARRATVSLPFCAKNIFARRVRVSAAEPEPEAAVAAEERSALATAAGAGGAGTICKLPSLSPFFSLRCRRRAEIDLAGLE